ncbi:CRISPR-associated protein [Algoriphagus chordae]|uniref:CRISPR-associated protein n=1 Tax=Algoriphagus chordae TaxID=237019 RepID=A0A2W7QIY3_9BACT|nr:CRISPR-associated protein [Algoriphagus chordae]PZX48283.1 hypothetical protein LV85_03693 [Algoriphagus chordae]
MLLNFSNHPSASWPENQIKIAQQWGVIQDLPFPPIDPTADEQEIDMLAQQYLSQILEINPNAVHVMGELTFSFKLIELLKSHGVTCIASTTSRNTQEMSDGTKVSKFEFVQFRSY